MPSVKKKVRKDSDCETSLESSQYTDEPTPKKRREESLDPSPTTSFVRRCKGPKAGVVKKIYMKNFMCHASLEVNFHSKINFVVGSNGSGKSSILTALVVGLGGKASTTNRGTSLKGFIKMGASSATVEVTLNNTGIYCYKYNEYGDNIVVTRILNAASGQSSYKLKSDRGTLISTKKEELDRIISALNIQVDNPVSVLNQDSARTFLNSSDPKEKFALFMKATQIEKLYTYYKESLLEKNRATEIINSRKESLDEAAKEVKDLENKWNRLQSLDDYRQKAVELENELYWSVVVAEENSVKKFQQILYEHSCKLPELQANLDKEKTLETETRKSLKNIDEQLQEKKSAVLRCEKEYHETRDTIIQRKELADAKLRNYKSAELKTQRIKDNVGTLQQAIENHSSVSISDQAVRRQEIQQLEEKFIDVKQTLKSNQQHYQKLKANAEKIKNDQHSLLQEKQEHTTIIEKRQREIKCLKNESHNSLTVFGSWAPRVSQKIDEAYKKGMFQLKPRGPLGAYIKLKDATWAPAIESFLGPLLKAYCVNSSKDSQILNQIFKEVLGGEKKPTIISSRFIENVHNVDKFSVKCKEYPSIMDMLIISDAVVFNALIDNREIESILLIPTGAETSKIMSDARIVPRNCKRAITKKGDQFYPDPNYRTYAGNGNTKAKFLQVSMQEAIREAENDFQNHIAQREEIDRQLKTVEQSYKGNTTEINAVSTKIRQLLNDSSNIESRLTELRDVEESEPNSVASLVAELKESTDAYNKAKEEESRLKNECQQLQKENEANESRLKNLRENWRKMQNEEFPLLNQRESLKNKLTEILLRKKNCDDQCKEMCEKIARIEADLSKHKETVKRKKEDALKICTRIDTERLPKAVEKELNDCKHYMASVEQHTGSLQEVGESYIEKKTKYKQIIDDLQVLEASLKKLQIMIDDRTKSIITIERLAALRVQHMFQSLMHSRKFIGELKIDHTKKTLDILVCPGNGKEINDTKSLSGGERSYSTVAFLMSLWDTVEPPFYFLDEFDVFMDKVNRRIIMDLLMEHARQKTNFQFVFLTPQDTSNIRSDPDVRIHRMEDPLRIDN